MSSYVFLYRYKYCVYKLYKNIAFFLLIILIKQIYIKMVPKKIMFTYINLI
jgi:hypothetical protein